ncbi:hypothetical protein Tco_0122388 [Tanacetum coccineum]
MPTSVSSSPSASAADWNPSVVEPVMNMNANGFPHGPTTTRSFNTSSHVNSVRRAGKTNTRPPTGIMLNGNNGISMGGLYTDGVGAVGSEASAGGSREWSSPFEEKELFSFPRQFVSSPSL